MKRNLHLIWALIILPVWTHAIVQPAPPPSRNALWEVQGAHSKVFLMGSIHMLRKKDYPLNEPIEQAFAESSSLGLEVDMGQYTDRDIKNLIAMKALLSGGNKLRDLLEKETYVQLDKLMGSLGTSWDSINHFKPWYLAITLLSTKMSAMGFDQRYGIDNYFYEKAVLAGKTIWGLETMESQMDVLNGLTNSIQNEFLRQTLYDLTLYEEKLEPIIASWATGRTEEMEYFLTESFKGFPSVYRDFIVKRNNQWMPRIEAQLKKDENSMIVVGVFHLVGKDGLLHLLEKQGYAVTQR